MQTDATLLAQQCWELLRPFAGSLRTRRDARATRASLDNDVIKKQRDHSNEHTSQRASSPIMTSKRAARGRAPRTHVSFRVRYYMTSLDIPQMESFHVAFHAGVFRGARFSSLPTKKELP